MRMRKSIIIESQITSLFSNSTRSRSPRPQPPSIVLPPFKTNVDQMSTRILEFAAANSSRPAMNDRPSIAARIRRKFYKFVQIIYRPFPQRPSSDYHRSIAAVARVPLSSRPARSSPKRRSSSTSIGFRQRARSHCIRSRRPTRRPHAAAKTSVCCPIARAVARKFPVRIWG